MLLNDEERDIVVAHEWTIKSFCQKKRIDIEEYYDILAITLCEAVKKWNKKNKLSTLLFVAYENKFISECRKMTAKKRDIKKRISLCEKNIDVIDYSSDLEAKAISKELLEIVNKEPIVKLFIKGYTREAIANKLGVTRAMVSRAIEKTKMEVEDYYKERDRENFK